LNETRFFATLVSIPNKDNFTKFQIFTSDSHKVWAVFQGEYCCYSRIVGVLHDVVLVRLGQLEHVGEVGGRLVAVERLQARLVTQLLEVNVVARHPPRLQVLYHPWQQKAEHGSLSRMADYVTRLRPWMADYITWLRPWMAYYVTWLRPWMAYYVTWLQPWMADYVTWLRPWMADYITWLRSWMAYYVTWLRPWMAYYVTWLRPWMADYVPWLRPWMADYITWLRPWMANYVTWLRPWMAYYVTWFSILNSYVTWFSILNSFLYGKLHNAFYSSSYFLPACFKLLLKWVSHTS